MMYLLLYLVVSFVTLIMLGYLISLVWRSWRSLDELELKDRFAARNDFIKTVIQLGGVFVIFAIYFNYASLMATQEKNITDLYTKAIEQLGNEKSLEVRLGGI